MKDIIVFRYGHRIVRDYRVSSHCALVARAFGAKKVVICGEKDNTIEKTIKEVNNRWGSSFEIVFVKDWKKELEKIKKKYKLIHLTMYGSEIKKKEEEIKKEQKICVIIGSQKVEKEIYEKSDYNISITKQPHSEIAALAVFLDRIQEGKELEKEFKGAKKEIIPQETGKKVISLK